MYDPVGANPVCVFCGSSPGASPVYGQAAEAVGKALADSGRHLVYGGGVRGLMGTVSAAALRAGGRSHGIIPKALTGRAVETAVNAARSGTSTPDAADQRAKFSSAEGKGGQVLTEEEGYDGRFTTEIVKSMHERKLRMAQMSTGGFVVLPGGFGTFEEVMEMVTWNQLGIHRLPIVVLNINDFFSPMRTQVQKAVQEGFIEPANYSLLKFVDLEEGQSVEDWGKQCVDALDTWTWDKNAGYGLQWDAKSESKE